MKRQQTPDAKWQAVLNDPQSPSGLKVEARAKLGLPSEREAYRQELDQTVQSFWGKRPPSDPEAALRDPTAARVYSALVSLLILGGVPSTIEDDSRILLNAYLECKSPWMRTHAGRALESALALNGESLSLDLKSRIELALERHEYAETQE
jgi:hypothetical protein